MYFREFGIPQRIERVFSVEEGLSLVDKYNGKTPCYTSVYLFDDAMDKHDGKTNYESAVINTIWFDFDDKNVKKCHLQVKRFIRQHCKPLGIIPRIYLTGGKGFQMNIDFYSPVDLPHHIKKDSIRDYLLHLKAKYKLTTMDEICINNSITCLRRIANTQYISKETGKPSGVWCVQLSVDEVMKLSIEEIYGIAMKPRDEEFETQQSKKALRKFIEFVADQYDIHHTVSNSVDYILSEIEMKSGTTMHSSIKARHHSGIDYIKPMRECIIKLIERNIERNHSNHEHNNIIATEMINAGYSDLDISFVFKSIYDEPAGDWGWYNDDISRPARHIKLIRQKALNRYSKDKLIRARVCDDKCSCGA